ncbi:cytochrome o ubiquinol oxidase subunit I [[Clostridium] nexile CAG:348]|nr:cytochrome o ubiquinol oxidase subunit I [[Clostridium] nexile CAG:348]
MPFLLMNGLNSGRRLSNLLWMLFFSYLKTINVSKKDKFGDAVRYALNQEKYLRVFLTDGDVPIDNNVSERAIRGFCIGKKNWQMIDTIHGANALNQEKYLRVFLTDGDVPIDNNASERAIRGFCIGKKNWQMIDTIHGAKSSAIIYSIVETAKANNLKPFDYVQHLLEEIPKHMNDKDCSFLEDLLPWSEKLPAGIRKA